MLHHKKCLSSLDRVLSNLIFLWVDVPTHRKGCGLHGLCPLLCGTCETSNIVFSVGHLVTKRILNCSSVCRESNWRWWKDYKTRLKRSNRGNELISLEKRKLAITIWKEGAVGDTPLLNCQHHEAQAFPLPLWAFLSLHPKITIQWLGILLAYNISFHPSQNI